jgi:hypothetical protein
VIDARINRYSSPACHICNRDVSLHDHPRWGNGSIGVYRGKTVVSFVQLCDSCADMDLAVSSAERDQLRFTRIGCGVDGISSYSGNRCICGAVTHERLGYCIECWKAHRMLDKAQAEARLISKALTELRKQIKTTQGAIAA